MTAAERFERAMQLFQRACDLPAQERSGFLAEACAADADLRCEVESLLEHDEAQGETVFSAEADGVAKALVDEVASATDLLPERFYPLLGE